MRRHFTTNRRHFTIVKSHFSAEKCLLFSKKSHLFWPQGLLAEHEKRMAQTFRYAQRNRPPASSPKTPFSRAC